MTERMWTPDDVSAYLQVPVQTLYQWRRKGFGPKARRVGKHLRWDPATVRSWFAALER
jgi:predicted DNA-binding transcriptional regulator AlpA